MKTSRRLLAALAAAVVVLAPVGATRAAAPSGRYVVGAKVVEDRRTRLLWRRQAEAQLSTWITGQTACQSILTEGGRWRLPTAAELQTIVDPSAAGVSIDAAAFPDTPVDAGFWSSTPYHRSSGSYWAVFFGADTPARVPGSSAGVMGSQQLHVRCVMESSLAP